MKKLEYPGVKDNLYCIEEDGRIWSNYKHDYMIPASDKNGYLKISLSGGSRENKIYARIATLVAFNFIGPPPDNMKDPTINHIDSNILNNHYTNLEWVERGYNSSIRANKGQGINNYQAKLTNEQVIQISELLVNTTLSYSEIGKLFNIKKSTVSNIYNKKNWLTITNDYDFSCRYMVKNAKGQFEIHNKNLEVNQ